MLPEPWDPVIRPDPHSYWNELRTVEPVASGIGAFGSGIHLGLGAPLARREAHIAFAAIRDRLGRLELDMQPEDLDWTPGFVLRGARSIRVRRAA